MTTDTAGRAAFQGEPAPRVARALVIEDGTLEALKWLALVLMTVDHVNKYLLHAGVPWMFAAGRLAMPLFAFVLAYNLARPDALSLGIYKRVTARLACFGAAASVPWMALDGLGWHWWPLNILFMFFVATICAWLADVGGRKNWLIAVAVFGLGGLVVEFWWPGVAACLFAWGYCRGPRWSMLLGLAVSLVALYPIAGNLWALGALPLVLIAPHAAMRVPRAQYLFYGYYPMHLGALWLIGATPSLGR